MRKMHNLLLNKVFSCFLAYLIVITPLINSITYAAKPHTLIPHYPPLLKGGEGGLKAGMGEFSDEVNKKKLLSAYMKLPLSFIKNEGQMDERVKFYEKGNGHTTFFTKDAIYLALSQGLGVRGQGSEVRDKKQEIENRQLTIDNWQSSIIKLIPLGANKDPEIIAEGLEEGRVNYFIGNDPEKWKADIPTYKAVVYKEIYPGIDMKFYGNNHQLEYDIVIKPGVDPSSVRLAYEGIEGLRVTEEGDLDIVLKSATQNSKLKTKNSHKITQKKPYIYQEIDGKRIEVDGKFKILNPKSLSEKSKRHGNVILSEAKNLCLPCNEEMLHFVQHDKGGTFSFAGSGMQPEPKHLGSIYKIEPAEKKG